MDITARDLFKHRQLSVLESSRTQDWLVFACKQAVEDTDDYERTLWGFRPTHDASPRQLTTSRFNASSPVLHPDGQTLAFLSDRNKDGLQVHFLPLDGGEACKLGRTSKCKLSSIDQWSCDGCTLLALATVEVTEDHEDNRKRIGRAPAVATYLPYKQDGAGITTGRRSHLFVLDATTGEPTALTHGDFDVDCGAWSPDGNALAYVRHRGGRERHRTDLWLAEADGSNPRRVADRFASIASFAWSPDGQRFLLAASEAEGDSSIGLWLVERNGANPRRLGGEDFELSPAAKPVWHPDGDRAAVIGETRGLHRLGIVDVESGTLRVHDFGILSVEGLVACGDRLHLIGTSHGELDEIHSVDWSGECMKTHSRFNVWFKQGGRPRVSLRRFDVPDGHGGEEAIEAWVLLPPADSGHGDGPFPLLVDMHGGPHSIALVDFSAHTYWYPLLSQGWAVVAPNAVGSTSYGQAFAHRLRGRWGELDLPQFEAVVAALRKDGTADDRVGCAGKSYGGFLAAWAIGHSTLFRAAVVAAPISNVLSHMGTSDTGYYVTPYAMDGEPDDVPALYRQLSPITHCHDASTATLILQGENDGRCPRGQSEELFAHLIHCTRVPVELVVYPDSSHAEAESGRPSNRVDYHERIGRWLARHIDAPVKAAAHGHGDDP